MGSVPLYCMLCVFVTITGLSHGVGVLPDNLQGAEGGSVMFNTTLTPGTPFVTMNWKFIGADSPINIVTVTSSIVYTPGYENRATVITSTGSLELRNLTVNDTGEYIIDVLPDGGTAISGTCRLEILMRVSNVVITPSTTDLIEFNSSVSLSCSASGSPHTYIWLNGSSEVTASDRVQITDGGSNLTIVNVTRYDQGPFKCQAFNLFSHDISGPVSLNISFGPENTNMKLSPSKEYHEKGSDISLSCSAVSRPAALFHWALNGVLLSDTGPELRLNNIQMSQSGHYSCQAYNNKTLRYQMSQPSRVIVLERISATSITGSPDQPVEEKPFNLTCDAAGSVFTREWRKDGSPLTPGNNMVLHDNNRVLSFSPVRRTDRGEYSCKVSNPVSFDEAKYLMTVNYGPDKAKITGPSKLTVNEPLKLTCSAESTPTASYIWKKNGTEIHRDSAEFTKTTTEPSDSGDYTCEATNSVTGKTSKSDVHRLSVTEKKSGSLSSGAIAGIVIASLIIVGGVVGGVMYYLHTQGKLPKKNANGNASARTGVGRDNTAPQELHYADINHLQNRGGGTVQMGLQGSSSTDYAEVRLNKTPGAASSPPTYDVHMQNLKRPAPQPAAQASDLYAQVRK